MTGPDEVEGIDAERVTAWLGERRQVEPPLRFHLIEGGRSNLTFCIEDGAGRRFVLRRPPLHSVLESAHDVAREHRIIAALAGADVPVPPVVGLEEDETVTGAPFYVMDFVEGPVVRDAADATELLDVEARGAVGRSLVDVLARLHAIDPDDVGLGDLARREDYIARQLKRWHGQLVKGRTRDIPVLDDVHARLSADVPTQVGVSLVHGDYRLDNLIVSPEGDVRAVLDWELCTLGDPMADLGLLMVYWSQAGDDMMPLGSAPTTVHGFPSRDEVVARYAERSGRDVSQLDYYVAFGYWKLAIILEGVFGRYASGAYGDVPEEAYASFGDIVLALADRAAELVTESGR